MKQLLCALLLSAVFAGSAHAQLVTDGARDDINMPDVQSLSDTGVSTAMPNVQQDEDGFLTLGDDPTLMGTQQGGQAAPPKTGAQKMVNNPAQQVYRGDQKQKLEAPRTHRMYEDNNFN